jgi:hypothetical protein
MEVRSNNSVTLSSNQDNAIGTEQECKLLDREPHGHRRRREASGWA